MARIPLRSDPTGLDLAALEAPPDWKVVFGGGEGPLEVEIGCGAGGFALEYCRRNPTVRYLAFEWRKKYAREVAFRGQKGGLGNLRVIEADAKQVLPKILAPSSVDAFHLQFPDPWWKRAHQRRAILWPDFTAFLVSRLKPGGLFDFRTDVEDRATPGLTLLEAAGLENPLGKGQFHPFDPDEVPSTRERRYLVTGQPVYRARLRKPI